MKELFDKSYACCRRARWAVVTIGLAACLGACGILGLGKELRAFNQDIMIGGRVTGELSSETLIYVAVQDHQAGGSLHSYTAFKPNEREQRYFFMLPPGDYHIIAFQDENGDRRLTPNEPVGEVLNGNLLHLSDEQGEPFGLNIVLRRETTAVPSLDLSNAGLGKRRPSTPATLGAIVHLDDPKFSSETARIGLWRPRRFMDQVVGGFFFLEPSQPDKKPVVFVHGALGHPGNWREIIDALDRDRYQPWLFYYPTAAGLEHVSAYLAWFIYELQAQLEFEHLTLVAHSMGGLVALRAAQILEDEHMGGYSPVDRLITLSTPWQGHRGAEIGVRFAPSVVPSWVDMAPNSEFLRKLAQRGLPTGVPHVLMFSYHGRRSLGENADGAVPLSSQLDLKYQVAAEHVIGFDETHRTILSSELPLKTLQKLQP